ncbi:MAG: glycosyltransferase [Rhodoferax sp.]
MALREAQEVVVDNHSSDLSMLPLTSQLQDQPRLKLIYSERNIGFAAGCNIGITAATQQRLLFINPDTILSKGALQRLLEVLDAELQGNGGAHLFCGRHGAALRGAAAGVVSVGVSPAPVAATFSPLVAGHGIAHEPRPGV